MINKFRAAIDRWCPNVTWWMFVLCFVYSATIIYIMKDRMISIMGFAKHGICG